MLPRSEKLLIIRNDWVLIRKIRTGLKEGGFILGPYLSTKDVWNHMKRVARA